VSATSVAAAAAYLLWLRLSGGSPGAHGRVVSSLFIALDVALLVLFWRASKRDVLARGTRRALRLMTTVAALAVVGRSLALWLDFGGGTAAVVSLADPFLLAIYPLTLAAFLSIPTGGRPTDRWKLALDAGMVISGVGVALWYFVLRDTAARGAPPLGVALALVYPLADLLILVAIVTVLLRHPTDGNRSAITWLAVSATLGVADDLFRSLLLARGGSLGTVWADALHLAASIALVVAAELFLRAQQPAEGVRAAGPRFRFVPALPFVAAGITYALLFAVATERWVAPLSGLALGAILVSCLLGARQILTQREQAIVVA